MLRDSGTLNKLKRGLSFTFKNRRMRNDRKRILTETLMVKAEYMIYENRNKTASCKHINIFLNVNFNNYTIMGYKCDSNNKTIL